MTTTPTSLQMVHHSCAKSANNSPCGNITVTWSNGARTASVGADRQGVPIPLADGTPTNFEDKAIPNGKYTYHVADYEQPGQNGPSGTAPIGINVQCPSSVSTFVIQKTLERNAQLEPFSADVERSSRRTLEGDFGTFELLVPRKSFIEDYKHKQGSVEEGPWSLFQKLDLPTDGSKLEATAVLLAPNYAMPRNLEAVAQVTPLQSEEGDFLIAYELDQQNGWGKPVTLVADNGAINRVSGSPAFILSSRETFELLVPRGASIDHYKHPDDTVMGPWELVQTLYLFPSDSLARVQATATAISLVQSYGIVGNLKAIARVTPLDKQSSDFLVAYDFEPESGWRGPFPVNTVGGSTNNITGSPALFFSSYEEGGKFELLVPRGASIDHYTLVNETVMGKKWIGVHQLSLNDPEAQVTTISLIQSLANELVAIARVSPPHDKGSDYLVAYEFNLVSGWRGPYQLFADGKPILAG